MKASKTCRPLQILRCLAPWAALLVLFAGLAAVRGLADSFTIDYDIMNGDFRWDIAVTPTPPLKSATVYVAYTDAGFSVYYEGGDE